MRVDDLIVGHIDWIARKSFAFYRNKADASDLAQETLMKMWRYRDRFDMSRDFKPWALTIMTNIFKTQTDRRGRLQFADNFDGYEPMHTHIENRAIFHDALRALRRAAKLSVGVECVMLYAKGYSYDEIATTVQTNVGTVKSRISSGRKLIRQMIDAPL